MVKLMEFEKLKLKARSLPLLPGVYLMKDSRGNVIYVGKAKKLKNRVNQYFQDTSSHSTKTKMMVSKIADFDIIVAKSEFEALVLECSLIKQHKPKYNILLKDDKGYPFLRVSVMDLYPRITVVSKVADDGAEYYGPYGSRGVTQALLKTILETLKLPQCSRRFPGDVGKDRPCLNFHMKQCAGWCQRGKDPDAYRRMIDLAIQLLKGNYKKVAAEIREKMEEASDALQFELAAELRDRLLMIEKLDRKQLVTATGAIDTDVIGYWQNEEKGCLTVLHYSNGSLLDKEIIITTSADTTEAAVTSVLKQFYSMKGCVPQQILLPCELEDRSLIEQYYIQIYQTRMHILFPQRGRNAHLVTLANQNAREEIERISDRKLSFNPTLVALGELLSIDTPERIEAFDISNISGTDIVAAMVVFVNGQPRPSEYKKFKIKELAEQNDYASMAQSLQRRFQRYLQGDQAFSKLPDLLLIDGGIAHTAVAAQVLSELGLSIPTFGMVKDDRHRTRALVTADGKEISITSKQSVFSFVGTIQEQTHRYAIGYHKKLRSKRIQASELDKINGVGPKRKQLLLKTFHSIRNIRSATISDLERILSKDAANAVYRHFHSVEE